MLERPLIKEESRLLDTSPVSPDVFTLFSDSLRFEISHCIGTDHVLPALAQRRPLDVNPLLERLESILPPGLELACFSYANPDIYSYFIYVRAPELKEYVPIVLLDISRAPTYLVKMQNDLMLAVGLVVGGATTDLWHVNHNDLEVTQSVIKRGVEDLRLPLKSSQQNLYQARAQWMHFLYPEFRPEES